MLEDKSFGHFYPLTISLFRTRRVTEWTPGVLFGFTERRKEMSFKGSFNWSGIKTEGIKSNGGIRAIVHPIVGGK